MAEHNGKGKKGFAGLSDLVSEVSGIDDPIKWEPKVEPEPSLQEQSKVATSEPERKSSSHPPPNESQSSVKSGDGLDNKWIIGIVGVILVIWLITSDDQSNNKTPYSPPSASQTKSNSLDTSSSAVQTQNTTQGNGLQYAKPSVGTNNVLSVAEIRWCIRENIRIEAMRNIIDTNEEVDKFNPIVNDYNRRCGSYRYRQGAVTRAEREVEKDRSKIVSEAIQEARQFGNSSPSDSQSLSITNTQKNPSAQHTRAAQQLLTELGYDPGPVDGDYGRRTADAVKAFQRDAGTSQDGWIDEDLLSTLRRAKAVYKPPFASQPKPQHQTSEQPRSNTLPTTKTKPENLSLEEQMRQNAAQRIADLGHIVDWRTSSLSDMLDAEARIGVANRLARLGHNVDWRTSSLSDMLDSEARIGVANRLKRKGISLNWQNYSLTQLLKMEYRQE